MYMKTCDSANPGSAIKLHGTVSYLIVPLKMFIYKSLKFAKIKMIAKICYSEICFDGPAVLEQVKKII